MMQYRNFFFSRFFSESPACRRCSTTRALHWTWKLSAVWVFFAFLIFPLSQSLSETESKNDSVFEWPGRFKTLLDAFAGDAVDEKMKALEELQKYPLHRIEKHLLDTLKDEEWQVRRKGANILVDKGSKRVLKALVAWLNDFETERRVEAVRLLGRTDKAITPIIRALRDLEPTVRIAALETLGEMEASEALTAILAKLDDDVVKVRLAAVSALKKIPDPRTVISLMEKSGDSATEVREKVIETLGRLGDARSASTLLRALADPSIEIRTTAARALGNLASKEAVTALIRILESDSSIEMHRAATTALAQIGTDEAAGALVRALGDTQKRAIATEGLKMMGRAAVDQAVKRLRQNGIHPPEAQTIVSILSKIGDHRASQVLVEELSRQRVDEELVVEALARCGDVSALIPLLLLLDKAETDDLKLKILDAIEPYADERCIEPLIAELETKNNTLLIRIVRLLGRLRAKKAVPEIIALLKHPDSKIRAASIRALGLIGDGRAENAIKPMLRSSDAKIRMEAADAIGRAGDPKSARRLVDRIETDISLPINTRAAYLRALGTMLRRKFDRETMRKLVDMALLEPHDLSLPALEAIHAAQNPETTQFLLNILKDGTTDRHKKIQIVSMLGDSKDKKALPILLESLKDETNAALSSAAAWSLGKLGDPRALPHLEKRWASTLHPALMINIAAAVGMLEKSPRADSLLWKMATHEDHYVRLNAILGLSKLHEKSPTADFHRVVAAAAKGTPHNSQPARHSLRILEKHKAPAKLIARAKTLVSPAKPGSETERWRHLHERFKFDWIAFRLTNRYDEPAGGAAFILTLGNGVTRAGYANPLGEVREEQIPEGDCRIILPANWPES